MLVTMMVMILVLFALYSMFDMGLRVFSFGNNKVEAVEDARLGLEKMEREIRGAYKVDMTASPAKNYLFFNANGSTSGPPQAMPTATQITFGNELYTAEASSNKIDCPSSTTCEYITYKLTDEASNTACTASPCTLRRVNTANASVFGEPLVE